MKTVTANGSTLLATYAYGSNNHLGSLNFGSGGSSVSYGWSLAGQLTSMVHDFTGTGYDLSTSYGYNPAQQVLSASINNSGFVYGASSAGTTGYSVNGLNQYTALSGLNAEALSYDAKGNLTSDGSFTYGYDAENRLTTAVSSSVAASYSYDPLGRRYQKTVNGTVTSYLSAGGGSTAFVPDSLNRYASVGGTSFGYDASGNLTSDGSFTYAYDPENRLMSAVSSSVTASYGYDPMGRRVTKTVGGTATYYLDSGDDEIAEYDASGNLTYRYVPGAAIDQPVARVAADGTTTFFHQNKQGSVIAMSDTSGAVTEGPIAVECEASAPPLSYLIM